MRGDDEMSIVPLKFTQTQGEKVDSLSACIDLHCLQVEKFGGQLP